MKTFASGEKRPFKASNGWFTRSMFADIMMKGSMSNPEIAPYWLERNLDGDKRLVMRDHFIATMDPTGYKTAIKFLGNYEHWEVLMGVEWFRSSVEKWVQEVKARQKSLAIEKIMDIALSDTSQSLAAAKYIATADYDKKDGRGRPSAAEVKGELKKAIQVADEDKDDMARIGLVN